MDRRDVRVIERRDVYAGYVRLGQWRLRHRLHSGAWSEEFNRELVEHGHGVAVLPYDPIRDEVVLIEQFRIGALGCGRAPWLIEIVAGLIEDGESAPAVARREAREEAGCELTDLLPVAEYLSSPGVLSESTALYIGRTDSSGIGGLHGLDHEHEDIRAFVMPFDSIEAMLDEGRISNATALIALQWLLRKREWIRSLWCAP